MYSGGLTDNGLNIASTKLQNRGYITIRDGNVQLTQKWIDAYGPERKRTPFHSINDIREIIFDADTSSEDFLYMSTVLMSLMKREYDPLEQ